MIYIEFFLYALLVALLVPWLTMVLTLMFFGPMWSLRRAELFDPMPYAVRDLITRSRVPRVLLMLDDAKRNHQGRRILGYAMQLTPFINVIVVDRIFLKTGSLIQLLFVVGHELGHHRMGHTSVVATVAANTGRYFLGIHDEAWSSGEESREFAANEYARLMTGIPVDVLADLMLVNDSVPCETR